MDRIDIHIQVPRVEYQKLRDMRKGESSVEVRVWVEAVRKRQGERFEGTDIASNADMRPRQIRKCCSLDDPCQALMKTAMRQLQLNARAYHRALKLSRTIADLAGSEAITQVQLAEALRNWPKLKLKKWLLNLLLFLEGFIGEDTNETDEPRWRLSHMWEHLRERSGYMDNYSLCPILFVAL